MSDLISREALLEAISADRYTNAQDAIYFITNAPAIEQGEAVIDKAAYDGAREDLSIWKRRALEAEEKVRKYDQRIVDIGVIAMTPVTTPQQTQSVTEALEKAVKLLESQQFMALDSTKTYTSEEYRQGLKSSIAFLAKQIRKLIPDMQPIKPKEGE